MAQIVALWTFFSHYVRIIWLLWMILLLYTSKSFTNFGLGELHVRRQCERIIAVSMLRFTSYKVKDRYKIAKAKIIYEKRWSFELCRSYSELRAIQSAITNVRSKEDMKWSSLVNQFHNVNVHQVNVTNVNSLSCFWSSNLLIQNTISWLSVFLVDYIFHIKKINVASVVPCVFLCTLI